MMSQNKSLFATGLTILIIVVSLFYFNRIYLEKVCNTLEVQIDFTAEKRDTLVFFSPDKKGGYSQSNSITVAYSKGQQSITFPVVLKHSDMPLRIDPGVTTNSITIHSISFTRFSNQERLVAADLSKFTVDSTGLSRDIVEDGLRVTFSQGDPQMFLQGYPLPSAGFYKVVAYSVVFLIVGLIGVVLLNQLQLTNRSLLLAAVFITFLGLLPAGYLLDWKFVVVVSLFTLFLYRFAKVAQDIFNQGIDGLKSFPLGAAVVIICFLSLTMGPFFKAVSPGSNFIARTPDSLVKALKNEKALPQKGKIRTLIDSFEESFFANFPFRKQLINLNATVKIFHLGYTPNSKAILGKEGMFFEGYGQRRVESDIVGSFDNITDYMGLIPFTEKELQAWLLCIEERYYWLKEQGIDYVFALAPTKALIYPENLPSRIFNIKNKLNKATRFEQLVTYLKDNSVVPVVDLRTELLSAKEDLKQKGIGDEYLLYYRTDFHWNYLGAFLAYQAIVKEINKAYPQYQFQPSQLEDFSIHKRTDWVHVRFIYGLGLNPAEHTNETYLTFYPKKDSIYNKIGSYGEQGINDYSTPPYITKEFGGKTIRLRELENAEAKTPLIVVMGDSFSGKFFGFFSKHAKKTIRFRTVYSFQPEIYTEAAPDLVIQEILNMYLLERPPGNPASIKGARERALTSSALEQSKITGLSQITDRYSVNQ